MALERRDDRMRARVEHAGHRQLVAVEGEHRLQRLHGLAGIALGEEPPVSQAGRWHAMADALRGEAVPWKRLARILLALGRHVGMAQDPLRRDRPAPEDVPGQGDHRGDLRLRVGRQPAGMGRMDDLDADRAGIEVGDALPGTPARVPGASGTIWTMPPSSNTR